MIPERGAVLACRSVFIMSSAPPVPPLRALVRSAGRVARRLVVPSLVAALLAAGHAQSLYGPDAPADVAFLRAVNASPAPVDVVVGDAATEGLEPGAGTGYLPVPAQEARFEVRRGEGDAASAEEVVPDAGPESFLTLLVLPDGTRVMEDPVLRDISRGLLVFVNATEEPLSLLVEDGEVAFEDVVGAPASRTIAEAAVGFEVVDAAGEPVGTIERRLFARGVAHTILAYEGPDGPAVSYLAASLAD